MQVCIVEDDARLASLLRQALEEDGSSITHLTSGEQAAVYIATHPFDAVVLDLMLPGTGGLDVLKQLRRLECHTPVLILSARDTVAEMVRALDTGADDYLTKPFHLHLFLARVRSISRRGVNPQAATLRSGPIELEPAQRTIRVQGQAIELTRREFMLIETLVRRAGQVITRDQLVEAVWGHAADISKGNLDFHIHSLRTKLGPEAGGMLRTLRGVGYMLAHQAAHS